MTFPTLLYIVLCIFTCFCLDFVLLFHSLRKHWCLHFLSLFSAVLLFLGDPVCLRGGRGALGFYEQRHSKDMTLL